MADANQVTEALTCIKAVRDRLEAWRDDAAMRLERAVPGNEETFRNLRENYRHLAEMLLQAELALGPLRPIPSAEHEPVDFSQWGEPANPDSVVRKERA